jgi:hypothetical protein
MVVLHYCNSLGEIWNLRVWEHMRRRRRPNSAKSGAQSHSCIIRCRRLELGHPTDASSTCYGASAPLVACCNATSHASALACIIELAP